MTFVLQEHHCVVLEDWIDFFDHPVSGLVVHLGRDPAIAPRIRELCKRRNIQLHDLGGTTPQETSEDEQALMKVQFAAVTADLGCVVRLDTLPYRASGSRWQDAAMSLMRATGACFVTGSTLPFRADRPTADKRFLLTQRISNCFLLIAPPVWAKLQSGTPDSATRYGRFLVEGAPEDHLAAHDLWGLRLVNDHDIRVLHCQEWGMRLLEVRRAFRKGHRVASYLTGYQDDFMGPRSRNYLEPKPPFARRVRIRLGQWKRRLLG